MDHQSRMYPAEFKGRVPWRIRMLQTVTAELGFLEPDQCGFLSRGHCYTTWTNSHGAVCAYTATGDQMGVKPDEFEVILWWGKPK